MRTPSSFNSSCARVLMLMLCSLTLLSGRLYAQVNLTVNILPPYSPYYADYSGINASKVLLLLQNQTNAPQQIQINGVLKGDNGVTISTRHQYKASQPIILNPLEVKQLNGVALKDIFDLNNLNVLGIDKVQLAQSSRLPEGIYSFCAQAVDYNSGKVLSGPMPGCTQINIIYPEPPVLVNPVQAGKVMASTPQTVVFNWINPGVVPIGTQYTIQMVEMPDIATDPNQVLNATSIFALLQKVSSLNYLYSLADLALKPGKRYAWRVIANDPSGKTLFKNNGVSGASYFTYGDNLPVINADVKPDLANLNLVTPACKANASVLIGEGADLTVGWLWREQLISQQYFGTIDTMLLKHYTQMATKNGMVALGKYNISFKRITSNLKSIKALKASQSNAPSVLSFNVNAPVQNFSLTYAQAIASKFIPGERYTVTITAFDTNGKQLEQLTSCEWLLQEVDKDAAPPLKIAGKLVYGFDKSAYYGANNTSITVQLTDAKTNAAVDMSKSYASTTTDANGNFTVQLKQLPADTGKKRLLVRINNPYYSQPDTNLLVKVPKLIYNTIGDAIAAKQDTLRLGDVKTSVFNHTLTVYVKKGFPKNLSWQDYEKMMPGDNKYTKDIFIDAATIDTMARVPDSTRVTIYRKEKATDIPAIEGQIADANPSGKTIKLGFEPVIKVAEGYTLGGAQGKANVVFKNLLCSFRANDSYYIQVTLPNNAQTQKEELYAPQTVYAYSPKNLNITRFTNSTTYNIISQKPPTAHVKGRIMYQWPSTPGVLHPYANKTIYVYRGTKAYDQQGQAITDECVLNGSEFTQKNGAAVAKWNLSAENTGIQVGQATTDVNGYFDIEVLTPTKMGPVDNVKLSKTGNPCPEIPKKEVDKKKEVVVVKRDLGGPIEKVARGGDDYSITMFPDDYLDFNSSAGIFDNYSLNGMLGNGVSGQYSGGMPGGALKQGVQVSAGPDNEEEEYVAKDESYVDRFFYLVGINQVAASDPAGAAKAARFIVQPFGTVNLGTITTDVKEISDFPVTLVTSDAGLATGAKMVVHRDFIAAASPKSLPLIPAGEGSIKHPVQKLLDPVFHTDKDSEPIEWVIDSALGFNKLKANLGKRRLWGDAKVVIYGFQVSPNPEGAAGYFKPEYRSVWGGGATIELKPLTSRIAGRVVNSANAQAMSKVPVKISIVGKSVTKTITTDAQGYFEYVNNQDGTFSWKDQDSLQVSASMYGYNSSSKQGQRVLAKGRSYYKNLSLTPNKLLTFKTVDAVTLKSVPGYAVTLDNYTVNNFDNTNPAVPKDTYGLYLTDVYSDKLHIIPMDPAYFDEYVPVDAGKKTLEPVKLHKRHHRMTFHITCPSVGLNSNMISIMINNKRYKRVKIKPDGQKDAYISFDFENVSINNYTVRVADSSANGIGLVPQIFQVQNQESKEFVQYEVSMQLGAKIWGNVKLDNKYVPNARVYIDYSTSSQSYDYGIKQGTVDYAQLQTVSGVNGSYTITGIPVTQASKIKVHATMETNVTIDGGEQTATVYPGKPTQVDLTMTTFNSFNINNIYGYPFAVEDIKKVNATTFQVTGMLDLGKNNKSPFKMMNGTERVRIQNEVITTKNLTTWVPVADTLKLYGVNSFRMSYGQYNVKVETPSTDKNIQPLKISKTQSGGMIDANVSIVDNSFNYPSTYLDFKDGSAKPTPFFLQDPAIKSAKGKPVIHAVHNFYQQPVTYHLTNDKSDSLQFSFIGFKDTKAAPDNSYVDPKTGMIHLDVTFKGAIPNSEQGYVKVHLKDLQLDGNTIKPLVGTEPIVADLQSWKLVVKNWTVDPKVGGIKSSDSYVATGIVDIPAKNFNLRSDMFVLSDFDVEKVSLGGGLVNLNGLKKENTFLVFDEACGSNHAPHWRFSSIGLNNQKVATIPLPAVPGKVAANNIDVDYFQLVSFNNENIVNLSAKQNTMQLFNNNKFKFLPASITSSTGSFDVTGSAYFGIPRVSAQAVSLTYTKGDMNVGNFAPLNFEGKGYVQFTSDAGAKFLPVAPNSHITSITGKVVEPGMFNPIPCTLTFGQKIGVAESDASTDMGTIILKQGYRLRLDAKQDKEATTSNLALIIGDAKTNYMAVDKGTKDWGTLKFSGVMDDPKSNKTADGSDAMQTQQNELSFDVLGDLSVTSKEMKMSQVATPLGKLNLVYDFPTYTLRGSLHMNKVKMGSYDFTGDIQTTIGPDGLLMLGSGKLNTGTLFVEGFGILNIGVLFGNTNLSPANIQTVTQYSKAKNSLCWLQDNKDAFKGFFLTGGLEVLDKHEKFDFVVASGYFNANLGVEASIGANFKKKNYMALLGAHGKVNAGLSSITGTSISGALAAHLTGMGSYTPNGFAINGDAGITIKYKISQYIPFVGTESFDGQKGAKINFGVGGGQKSHFDFSLAEDGNAVVCTQNGNVQ